VLSDARRRRFDVLVVWRLDRLGRNLRHLITPLEELQALGIAFVSLNKGIDATSAGKLQMNMAKAQFPRFSSGSELSCCGFAPHWYLQNAHLNTLTASPRFDCSGAGP
jgi:Resolvase, N terminal domain